MVNGPNHWFNIYQGAFIILSDPVKVIELQKSLLDTWKSSTSFLDTLTAGDKYSLISGDKWMETIQMHLSQKQNTFS